MDPQTPVPLARAEAQGPSPEGAWEAAEYPALRERLVRYARKLTGDELLDGRNAEDWADLALLKMWRGERRVGVHEVETVLLGTVRSLVHHARKREERQRRIESTDGEVGVRAVDAMHLRDALRKVAEHLQGAGCEDGRAVVLCLLEHESALLKPRELAEVLRWERTRVYKAWERVKAQFTKVWNGER